MVQVFVPTLQLISNKCCEDLALTTLYFWFFSKIHLYQNVSVINSTNSY